MKAIIYCRVSTQEQVMEGNSLQSQERMCKEFASKNGYELDKVFVEQGESAKTAYRTKLNEMLKYCSLKKDISVLLVYKIDRLSRNVRDYDNLKILFATNGVRVISITEPIEDSPVGRLTEYLLAGIAQFDNEVRGERSKNGMLEAMKQGRWVFQAPYGFKTEGTKGNSNIVPIPSQVKGIKKTFELLSQGYNTVEEIRRDAIKYGMKREDGKPLNIGYFHKIIRNPVYKGYIDVPSMGINQKGSFSAIVAPEIFDLVQEILQGKRKKLAIYKKLNADFPLRGTLRCECGALMTASWTRHKFGYYRCMSCKTTNINKKILEPAFSEFLKTIQWHVNTTELVKEAMLLNWESHKKEFEKELHEINKKKADIEVTRDKIVEKNLKGVYADSLAKVKLAECEKKLSELNIEAYKYVSPEVMEKDLLDYTTNFLMNMTSVWDTLKIEPKHKLQKMLFPEGVMFLNGKFATVRKSHIVELNELVSVGNSSLVTLRGIEPLLPG